MNADVLLLIGLAVLLGASLSVVVLHIYLWGVRLAGRRR